MRLLVDTNRFSDLAANRPESHSLLQNAAELWLSIISLGELRAGFQKGSRQANNEKRLSQLLALQGVQILLMDEATSHYYADIWYTLHRNGTPIPTNDIWIAAQAIQHNLTLDSRDEHFRLVPGLHVVK